jgi:hypothetical protein
LNNKRSVTANLWVASTCHLPRSLIECILQCEQLTEAKFGKNLGSIGSKTFYNCPRLERITTPLKRDIVTFDDVFQGCRKFKHVDLVEREVLDKTIAALQLEEWRNTMNVVIHQKITFFPMHLLGTLKRREIRPRKKPVDYNCPRPNRLLQGKASSYIERGCIWTPVCFTK